MHKQYMKQNWSRPLNSHTGVKLYCKSIENEKQIYKDPGWLWGDFKQEFPMGPLSHRRIGSFYRFPSSKTSKGAYLQISLQVASSFWQLGVPYSVFSQTNISLSIGMYRLQFFNSSITAGVQSCQGDLLVHTLPKDMILAAASYRDDWLNCKLP